MDEQRIRKMKRWSKIGGAVVGGLTTILTPLMIMYYEVKPSIEAQATEEAETGYEAVVPAIVEIQEILNDAKKWAENVDDELDDVAGFHKDIEKRLARCEAYIEVLGRRRNLPSPPAPDGDDAVSTMIDEPDIHRDAPPVQRTATYEMPKNLGAAKRKVSDRKRKGCSPDDPLCSGD